MRNKTNAPLDKKKFTLSSAKWLNPKIFEAKRIKRKLERNWRHSFHH